MFIAQQVGVVVIIVLVILILFVAVIGYKDDVIYSLKLENSELLAENEKLKLQCIGLYNNKVCNGCNIKCSSIYGRKFEFMEKVVEKIGNLGIREHLEFMEAHSPVLINLTINNTKVYENTLDVEDKSPRFNETKICIHNFNVMSIFESKYSLKTEVKNVAVVNPASFADPCGMFLSKEPFNGDTVEEDIAKNTNLANILYSFKDTFYDYNKHNEQFKGLYSNRSLFIPEVIYRDVSDAGVKLNIISISPPDSLKFKKSFLINPFDANKKIYNAYALRIEMLFNIALENGIDTLLISGFGSDEGKVKPEVVAGLFNTYLNGRYKNVFKEVHFCIRKTDEDNSVYNRFRYEFIERK